MAVVSKDDIMQALSAIVGENDDENVISFLENLTDTLSDYETKTQDTTDWKQKYDELDGSWKKKYRERFFTPEEVVEKIEEVKEEQTEDVERDSEPQDFDELFESREG